MATSLTPIMPEDSYHRLVVVLIVLNHFTLQPEFSIQCRLQSVKRYYGSSQCQPPVMSPKLSTEFNIFTELLAELPNLEAQNKNNRKRDSQISRPRFHDVGDCIYIACPRSTGLCTQSSFRGTKAFYILDMTSISNVA